MTEITAVIDIDDRIFDDILEAEGLGEGITAAIESIHVIYQGLLTTPVSRYSEPAIRGALNDRLNTISDATGVSLESLPIDIERLGKVDVSQEASLASAVTTIVNKILEYLSRIKQFFQSLWQKVFNRKNTVVAASKATAARYDTTVKTYTQSKKEIPTRVVCNVPGKCYLLFHARPHIPKAGFVYNQQGLDKAISSVSGQVDLLIEAMSSEVDTTLDAVRTLLSQLGSPHTSTVNPGKAAIGSLDEPLKNLKTNRKMYGLFHDHFEVIGVGVITKPLRHATRHHSEKFALTDTVRKHGWASVDNFDITIDVSSIKSLTDSVAKNANEKLTGIAMLVDRVTKSREIEQLTKRLKDQREVSALAAMANGTGTQAGDQRRVLDRLELLSEYVNQLSDNLSLLYSFYARYIETLSVITQRAVVELQNHS